MKKRLLCIFTIIVSMILLCSTSIAGPQPFNTAKIKSYFEKNSNDEWVYDQQISSSDCIVGLSFVLSPSSSKTGKYSTAFYGYYFSTSDFQFCDTKGYYFIIDGHKYKFSDCQISYTFSSNYGEAVCGYVHHSKLDSIIKGLAKAKNVTIGIDFEMKEYKGIVISYETTLGSSNLKKLKSMASALIASNYFDNIADSSVYESLVTFEE